MESVWAPAILRAPRHGRRCSSHSLIHAAAHRHLSSLRRHVQRHLRPCPVAALRSDDPDDGHRPPFDPAAAAQASLRAVLALVAAVLLHLGGGTVSDAAQASVAEDKLLEFVRQVEVKLDGAVGAVKEAAGQGSDDGPDAASARELVAEVCEVVELNFSDARSSGYDRQEWLELKERVLARPLRSSDAAHTAIRELLAALRDPYSRFVPASDFAAMLKYDVSGVGLNLGTAEEFVNKTGLPLPEGRDSSSPAAGDGVWVLGLIRGSAAEQAGVNQGDQLLELDGRRLAGRSPFEVASLLQGQEEERQGLGLQGTPVQVKVRRADGREDLVTLQRPTRVLPSPVSSRLEAAAGGERVGVVKLSNFNARAQRDTLAALQRLQDAGAERLVLDLRDNRGGLVSEGVEIARLFLGGDALVVRTEGRARSSAAPITAPGPAASAAPLVVLVNDHTASASEILAGALQDNCRAVLAGRQTYGKGLIQSVYELSDGSGLVLTVGKYVTPNGTDIDREGLRPDFSGQPSAAAADSAIQACQLRRGAR